MDNIVDARGLSCPQPVLMTLNRIKKAGSGEIVVLVDTDTSKDNVSRAARSPGWQLADICREGIGYQLTLERE